MTNPPTQFEYLLKMIDGRLQRLDQAVVWYRKTHFRGQMAVVVLSAAITIVAGLKHVPILPSASSDIVLILGAVLTVISSWAAFFSPKESWHLNARIYGKLRALQASIQFQACHPEFVQNEERALNEAFSEYQEILAEYNAEWQNLRTKSK